MPSNIVLTLTGKDRVGIVEEVTRLLLDLGGNVETSRMSRLGGEFAVILLASLPAGKAGGLNEAVERLKEKGFSVAAGRTEPSYAETRAGWSPWRIEVHGADHEGIIHEVARLLAGRGISIESMETETGRAPLSGTPLFTMVGRIMVPPGLKELDWTPALAGAGKELNVDIRLSPIVDT
jgi:glycine cleavage system transcriptional repressor